MPMILGGAKPLMHQLHLQNTQITHRMQTVGRMLTETATPYYANTQSVHLMSKSRGRLINQTNKPKNTSKQHKSGILRLYK